MRTLAGKTFVIRCNRCWTESTVKETVCPNCLSRDVMKTGAQG